MPQIECLKCGAVLAEIVRGKLIIDHRTCTLREITPDKRTIVKCDACGHMRIIRMVDWCTNLPR